MHSCGSSAPTSWIARKLGSHLVHLTEVLVRLRDSGIARVGGRAPEADLGTEFPIRECVDDSRGLVPSRLNRIVVPVRGKTNDEQRFFDRDARRFPDARRGTGRCAKPAFQPHLDRLPHGDPADPMKAQLRVRPLVDDSLEARHAKSVGCRSRSDLRLLRCGRDDCDPARGSANASATTGPQPVEPAHDTRSMWRWSGHGHAGCVE